jgi:DNA-binding MarR family transcriptional regulator
VLLSFVEMGGWHGHVFLCTGWMLAQEFIAKYIDSKPIFGQFALLFRTTTRLPYRSAPARPAMTTPPSSPPIAAIDDRWRLGHLGRLMGEALRRFDNRVLHLMAHDPDVPLALSNLAARQQVGAAHVHITRHLPLEGARLTELAARAGMTKQAMGALVDQCEAWGLVRREPDPRDARARRIVFTATGLLWQEAFRRAVAQAEAEFRALVGEEVATVVALGLEAYGR